ncbi:uncharacterized protein LOC123299407 [Chrysoperla carnea]|uniref:uncharacterized protein LOC123299407 n=1 Tax=Chrysoperla carnea TaxID=189513 RepID=UPI001D0612E4|nr:uncharacterized protein LOC123299407 [Chrysoperla carnea]
MFVYFMFSVLLLTKSTPGFAQNNEVYILRNQNQNKENGVYDLVYELSDGTKVESHGQLDENKNSNVYGSYEFQEKDRIHYVSYVADKNGFRSKVHSPLASTNAYDDIFQYETNTLNPFLRTNSPIELDSRILGIIVKSPAKRGVQGRQGG